MKFSKFKLFFLSLSLISYNNAFELRDPNFNSSYLLTLNNYYTNIKGLNSGFLFNVSPFVQNAKHNEIPFNNEKMQNRQGGAIINGYLQFEKLFSGLGSFNLWLSINSTLLVEHSKYSRKNSQLTIDQSHTRINILDGLQVRLGHNHYFCDNKLYAGLYAVGGVSGLTGFVGEIVRKNFGTLGAGLQTGAVIKISQNSDLSLMADLKYRYLFTGKFDFDAKLKNIIDLWTAAHFRYCGFHLETGFDYYYAAISLYTIYVALGYDINMSNGHVFNIGVAGLVELSNLSNDRFKNWAIWTNFALVF